MSGPRLRLGDAGERYAERRLTERGWTILDRKWRGTAGELDLVADDGQMIVFVEVKTRRGDSHGRAEEAVSATKCATIIRLGEEFVQAHPELENRYWRVDTVAITLDRDGRVDRFSHIEDACLDE